MENYGTCFFLPLDDENQWKLYRKPSYLLVKTWFDDRNMNDDSHIIDDRFYD